MVQKTLFITIFFSLFSFLAKPQEAEEILISGKVVDHRFKEGISYALVAIVEERGSYVADSLGNFRLYALAGQHLEISALGFRSIKIAVSAYFTENNNYCHDLSLEVAAIPLKEVVVHSLGTWGDFKENFVKGNFHDKQYRDEKRLKEMFNDEQYFHGNPDTANYGYIPYFGKPKIAKELFDPTTPLQFSISNLWGYYFSKTDKEKRRIYALIKHDEMIAENTYKYNAEIIAEATGLEGEALNLFKTWCDEKIVLGTSVNDYDVIIQIKKLYDEYLQQKPR